MPKNITPSQLDNHQITKLSFDQCHDAVRVIDVLDKKHEIEISAESGDSIQSVARAKALTKDDGPMDCSCMRKMCGFNAATASLSADGVGWSDPINMSQSLVMDLCAMQIKVLSGTVVVRS